jgi:excisionase family DNA binding protein
MKIDLITTDDVALLLKKMDALEKKVDALNNGISSKGLFTINEACDLLQVSKRTLQRYRDEGLLSFTQVSGKIMFQKTDIEVFLNGNRVEAFKKKGGSYANR